MNDNAEMFRHVRDVGSDADYMEAMLDWLVATAVNASKKAEFISEDNQYSIASGHAGYALMLTQLSRTTRRYGRKRETHDLLDLSQQHLLKAAKKWKTSDYRSYGLFDGVTGYILALDAYDRTAGNGKQRASRLAHKVKLEIMDSLSRRSFGSPYIQPLYDVISGASGALSACQLVDPTSGFENTAPLTAILETLPRNPANDFYISEYFPSEELYQKYPDGYIDFGVAHGVAGIVPRLINLCDDYIFMNSELTRQLSRYVTWLIEMTLGPASEGIHTVSEKPERTSMNETKPISGMEGTWCYGQLARIASIQALPCTIIEPRAHHLMNEYLKKVLTTEKLQLIADSLYGSGKLGLCHGLAGFLLTLRFLISNVEQIRDGIPLSQESSDFIADQVARLKHDIPYKDLMTEDCRNTGFLNGITGTISSVLYLSCDPIADTCDELDVMFFGHRRIREITL